MQTPAPSAAPSATASDPAVARAIALARAMLARHGAQDWPLCFASPVYHRDWLRALAALFPGSRGAWEPFSDIGAVHYISQGRSDDGLSERLHAEIMGLFFDPVAKFAFLRIPVHVEGQSDLHWFRIVAMPTAEEAATTISRMDAFTERERVNGVAPVREVIGNETPDLSRALYDGASAPLLAEKTQAALEHEITEFFSDKWRGLARKNRIPYKRGVLLHGPPGNGKTSALRDCLRRMPQVAVVLCRPVGEGDIGATLETAIRLWRKTAPAVLVIEDLDSLFADFPVSNFLNMLDGVTALKEDGLLLVATTNKPEQLDSALSNRPGRFDTAIRFPAPDAKLRRAYFARELDAAEKAQLTPADIDKLSKETQRLSFAHLREIVIRSGLAAARDGREGRSAEDLLAAAKVVAKGAFEADGGFKEEAQAFGFSGAVAEA